MDEDFADWYTALRPRVLRAVTIAVGDRDLAEEATAEAFARALARWPAGAALDSPVTWLLKVAVNEVRTRWRRGRLERRHLQRLAAEPERHTPAAEPRDDALWAAVAALPERSRQMVAMRYVLDLAEHEIAAALGVTRGTVASTLSRARQQLATAITREETP
ncbi:RNA polymerase sigma factor [Jiangella ureilytica]|nr:sigma-70 family RNA polymerase sigma factor [Jiangella ureilytica]